MTPQTESALAMLKQLPGARIINCPAFRKGSRVSNWAEAATSDPASIEKMFDVLAEFSDDGPPNVGLVVGPRVAVLDVEGPDKEKEKSRDGLANVAALEDRLGRLPFTLRVDTPSGGEHRYYVVPDGIELKPSSRLLGVDGVELRTGNQLVMIPPSRMRKVAGSVVEYAFAAGYGPNEVAVADLPAEWIAAILGAEQQDRTREPKLTKLLLTPPSPAGKTPQLPPIFAGCRFMQHVVEDAATLSEPEWYAALSIISLCENGTRLAHEISKPYPSYNFNETQRKIEHAITDAKPRTCKNIATDLGFPGCARCPLRAMRKTSPIALGYQSENLVKEQSRVVYVVNTEQYVELESMTRHRPTAFAAKVRDQVGKGPHDKFMGSQTTPKVDQTDYLPGNDDLIVIADGRKTLNCWVRDGIVPADGDCSRLQSFIEYLIPDRASRSHLLDYLAWLLQHRGSKIKHAIILTGPFGVGKSSFNILIKQLFGANSRRIEGEQLGSKWSEQFVNCEILVAEEACLGERHETSERLKELITGEHFVAEQKYQALYPGRTPRGIFIASNHINPISVPVNDRRFCVIATAVGKASVEFYQAVHAALADDATVAAFAHWLLDRDISAFNPHVEPPMTRAKGLAIAASRTPVAQIITEAIEDGRLWRQIVTVEEVHALVSSGPWALMKVTKNKIGAALTEIGAIQLNRLRVGSRLVRPWALKNIADWVKADAERVRLELNRGPSREVFEDMPNAAQMSPGALFSTTLPHEVSRS